MSNERPSAKPDSLNRRDLEVILEVNRKAVEIETEVVGQNEEIIDLLNTAEKKQEEIFKKSEDVLKKIDDNYKKTEEVYKKLDEADKKLNDVSKELFKIQVLFITGLLSLVAQIVQMFIKK